MKLLSILSAFAFAFSLAIRVIAGQTGTFDMSPDGGKVSISARPRPDGAEVRVSDEGVGVPRADHQRIFVPVTTGAEDLVTAVQALGAAGIIVADIALRQPTLDDVFLTLTGHTTEWKAFDDSDGDGADGDGAAKKRDKRKARA